MTVANEINRVKYIAEDFATYRSEADDFFRTYYPAEFNNLLATDLGNALMDQLAFAMQSLSFMVNRKSSELFLATARLNKSITKLARMLGYPIKSASPATTDLTITLTEGPYVFPITLSYGMQFQGPGDTVYEFRGAVPITIAPGETVVTIPIKEGQTKRLTFVSTGEQNQQFSVFGIPTGQFLYSDDFSMTVDGTTWDRQDLIKYEASNIYEVLFTDDPPKLRFGDGIAGNIPPDKSQIVVVFAYGKGAAGAIGQNQISGAIEEFAVNGITIPMSFTNTVSDVGEDPEDIRHVRSYASSFFRTQNAAVVKTDYDTIATLESGVALADAQIMRGISNDITIQSCLSGVDAGQALIHQAMVDMVATDVSGISFLGVSGIDGLAVSGTDLLSVSGVGTLGVAGIQYLGTDVSGNITGISYLNVSGQSNLGVAGTNLLFVSGVSGLGVSGIGDLGISGKENILSEGTSGITLIDNNLSSLSAYLSQTMSDTCASNNIQVIVLSADANNKYIPPSSTTLTNVQAKLQSLCDAVVTVFAVDGSSRIVNADVKVEIGINQTAIKEDVQSKSLDALIKSTAPYGLLVKRSAGVSLYISDIDKAIRDANTEGDLRFVNIKITGPISMIDSDGNLIISKQQLIQNGTVSVKVTKRVLVNGEVTNA